MEFHVTVTGQAPDLAAIETALGGADPAAMVDFDPAYQQLRISAALTAAGVGRVLAEAGCPVLPTDIRPQPSVCCGGCSG